jgi:uncharacterized protein YndB with AHSA1/START domain
MLSTQATAINLLRIENMTTGKLKRDLVITRIFDAPRSLVWKAWTDPKQVAQWWGPQGFTNPLCECAQKTAGSRLHVRAWL